MELISQLTEQLGVSNQQATGGAGLIFNMVKSKLGGGDFSQVSSAIPEVDKLIESAPAKSGVGSAIGGMVSSLTGGKSGLESLASLTEGFSGLGLDSGMVGKFVPVVLSFVQSRGGDTVKNLIEKVLK